MNKTRTSKLFVYGTLKRGYGNNFLLRDATFIGAAISKSAMYRMHATGFPILVDDPLGARVAGELYEVDHATLTHCDHLERHPRWYRRHKRRFAMADGTVHKAWVYVMPVEYAKSYPLWQQGGTLEWSSQYRREIEQRRVAKTMMPRPMRCPYCGTPPGMPHANTCTVENANV